MATMDEKLKGLAVLDNFNRIENPLATANWTLMKTGATKGKCQNTEGSEGWTPVTGFVTNFDGAFWNPTKLVVSGATMMAARFDITRIGSAERQTGLWLCRTSEEVASGYYLRMEKKEFEENKIKYTLEKWVAGVPTVIKETTTTEFKKGSRFAIVLGEGKLQMWAAVEAASEFKEVMSVADGTYLEGFAGIMGKGTGEMIAKNFAAGTFVLNEGKEIIIPRTPHRGLIMSGRRSQ